MVSAESAAKQTQLTLTEDEIDDVLYLVRANEHEELQSTIRELAGRYTGSSDRDILEGCIDPQSGNTILHFCAANGLNDLLKTLLQQLDLSQLPTGPVAVSNSPESSLLNHCNASGNTPLHWAAVNGHTDAVKLLVDAGAELWIRNGAGNLAVFEAETADKEQVVAVLLQAAGDKEAAGDNVGTAGDESGRENGEQDGEHDGVAETEEAMEGVSLSG